MQILNFDYSIITANLTNVGVSLMFFGCFWLANFAFSIYYNIGVAKESFKLTKLLKGLFKLLAICFGMSCLTLAISGLPLFLQHVGIPLPEAWTEVFNVTAMLTVVLTGAVSYGKEAIATATNIFSGVKNTNDN